MIFIRFEKLKFYHILFDINIQRTDILKHRIEKQYLDMFKKIFIKQKKFIY